jgi:hypothetical protein
MTHKIEITPGVEVLVICEEPEDMCEQCGKKDELRPYGKRVESGRRRRICYDCAMLDKPTTDTAFKELFE